MRTLALAALLLTVSTGTVFAADAAPNRQNAYNKVRGLRGFVPMRPPATWR